MKSGNFSFATALRHKPFHIARLALLAALATPILPATAGAQMLVDGVESGSPINGATSTSSATRFIQAGEYLSKGMKAQARVELAVLSLTKDFILADYVAYDLASLAIEEKDYKSAAGFLEEARHALEASPAHKDANRLRLMAACADEASSECGAALAAITKKEIHSGFIPARMMIEAARAEKTGGPAEAYRIYHETAFRHPASGEAGAAMGHMERLRAAHGAKSPPAFPAPSYQDRLGRVLRLMDANMHEEAAHGLEELIAGGQTDEREAMLRHMLGSALYKGRLREKAREVFLAFAVDYPDHDQRPMAEYYVAIIDWNRNKDAESRARLEKLAADGTMSVRGLANYTLGRMAETDRDFTAAGNFYATAARLGVPHRLKSDLWWRMGWAEYKKEKYKEAANIFRKGMAAAASRHDDGRFVYWRGKALEAGGDLPAASQAEAELYRKYPYSYYGLAGKTAGLKADPLANSVTGPTAAKTSDIDAPESLSPAGRRRLERASLLIQAQFPGRAEKELDLIAPEIKKTSAALAWLGSMYLRAGAAHRAMRLFGSAPGAGENGDDFGDTAWRLAYPISNWERVAGEAAKANIDPLLPLAVIRQESSFNDRVVSKANAIGLMQLMPNTGEKMYNQMKLSGGGAPFTREMLFNPRVNITLGVAHLSDLLAHYDGALAMALAAYNAGSPAVDLWRKRLGQAPEEEFIEMIPYTETRDYVKKVLRNLALYRSIYSRVEVTERRPAYKPAM
jgi:soluble lytic murein transglycosylase